MWYHVIVLCTSCTKTEYLQVYAICMHVPMYMYVHMYIHKQTLCIHMYMRVDCARVHARKHTTLFIVTNLNWYFRKYDTTISNESSILRKKYWLSKHKAIKVFQVWGSSEIFYISSFDNLLLRVYVKSFDYSEIMKRPIFFSWQFIH